MAILDRGVKWLILRANINFPITRIPEDALFLYILGILSIKNGRGWGGSYSGNRV